MLKASQLFDITELKADLCLWNHLVREVVGEELISALKAPDALPGDR